MRTPLYVRALSTTEKHALRKGLRSADAFVLRRCQILLASAQGQPAREIADHLGLRRPDRAQCHPCVQCPGARGLATPVVGAPSHPACRLRLRPTRAIACPAPPEPSDLWQAHQRVDASAGGRRGLCRGYYPPAGQRRNDSPGLGCPQDAVETGQTLDHQSRPGISRKKNSAIASSGSRPPTPTGRSALRMKSGGAAWPSPQCTPGPVRAQPCGWSKKLVPQTIPIRRPWRVMECWCGPFPRSRAALAPVRRGPARQCADDASFSPGAAPAWPGAACAPYCSCGTMLPGIPVRQSGPGYAITTARSNSRGWRAHLSHAGCPAKALG